MKRLEHPNHGRWHVISHQVPLSMSDFMLRYLEWMAGSNYSPARDRAIVETLYSTGLRRQELLKLLPHDIDWERGTLMVRQAKGHKDRMIPIGDRALAWLRKYIDEVRASYVVEPEDKPIFLNNCGRPMTLGRLTQMVRMTIDASGISKRGSCQLFRHTIATAMLEHGADIRYIQQMLGHSKLESTQIYTRVSIRKLKEVHTETHPARFTP